MHDRATRESARLHKATHIVLSGKLKFPCVQFDNAMLDIVTGETRAVYRRGRWSRPVSPVRPDNPNAIGRGRWDHVRPSPYYVVKTVKLDKGRYY